MSRPIIHFLETVDATAMRAPTGSAYEFAPPTSEPPGTRVHALILRGKERVDRDVIDRLPELKAIARCGVGVNNIDVEYATERGVQVLNVPGVNADTVAEHTVGLMLMLVRGMHRLVEEVKAGNWAYRNAYAGQELRQLTLGIVGMGDIGKKVGGVAGALQMRVKEAGRDAAERSRLYAESDVISLHVPLTEETRRMIDASAFNAFKPGAFLINTARGEIVDAEALLDALTSGHIGGYASDLLPVGGKAGTVAALLQREDVLITPHAASLTALTYQEMSQLTVANTLEYLENGLIDDRYRVNRLSSTGR